jgi:NAD(P)-dependent dehydrogenase (short-subunit alcohol dehydrogenase family)
MSRTPGKRIVITGGTSGLGLTTAKHLLDQGARVVVTGRGKEAIDAARATLGPGAFVIQSDTSSLADIDKLAARVKAELGEIDLLFLNAGISRFVPFEAMTEAVYDEVLGINAKGPYFTAQKLAPLLPAGSAIVVTTSVINEMGFPMTSAYSASKAALRSMVRTLAAELLPRGIRVNAISPGPIETGILEKTLGHAAAEPIKQQMRDGNPMKRFGHPDEIARAVAFLAFDATYTTGAELVVDGGASQL